MLGENGLLVQWPADPEPVPGQGLVQTPCVQLQMQLLKLTLVLVTPLVIVSYKGILDDTYLWLIMKLQVTGENGQVVLWLVELEPGPEPELALIQCALLLSLHQRLIIVLTILHAWVRSRYQIFFTLLINLPTSSEFWPSQLNWANLWKEFYLLDLLPLRKQ